MTAPDMTASIAPRSDQLNAEDLITGPRTITVVELRRGSVEQPVEIVTEEFGPGRPYKPSKTMRRVLVVAWGADPTVYPGRRMTIYRDPDITFGKERVGGIRISHLSNIEARMELSLTVTRGRRSMFTVEPLPDGPPAITDADVVDFERRIDVADTISALDTIARDLKARNLGAYHESLLTAWKERRAAIGSADSE